MYLLYQIFVNMGNNLREEQTEVMDARLHTVTSIRYSRANAESDKKNQNEWKRSQKMKQTFKFEEYG